MVGKREVHPFLYLTALEPEKVTLFPVNKFSVLVLPLPVDPTTCIYVYVTPTTCFIFKIKYTDKKPTTCSETGEIRSCSEFLNTKMQDSGLKFDFDASTVLVLVFCKLRSRISMIFSGGVPSLMLLQWLDVFSLIDSVLDTLYLSLIFLDTQMSLAPTNVSPSVRQLVRPLVILWNFWVKFAAIQLAPDTLD